MSSSRVPYRRCCYWPALTGWTKILLWDKCKVREREQVVEGTVGYFSRLFVFSVVFSIILTHCLCSSVDPYSDSNYVCTVQYMENSKYTDFIALFKMILL